MNPRGLRQSAATLAAMHPADRRWTLARLSATSAAALAALLRELDALGPVPPDWLAQALESLRVEGFATPPPSTLIRILDGLSPTWAARMLAATAPDHVELYLATCLPARTLAIRGALDQPRGALPIELTRTLARELQHIVHALPASDGAMVDASRRSA